MSEININVSVGVTPRLEALLATIARQIADLHAPGAAQKPVEFPAPLLPPEPPTAEVAPVAKPEPVAEPVSEPQKTEHPTETDIRSAMDRARKKIEGEGYNNTEHELYKKWHGRLNTWFKSQAAFFGAEKPTAIEPGKRQGFIAVCDAVCLEGEVIKTEAPF